MGKPNFMTRAERVERLIGDVKRRYEEDHVFHDSLPDHWVDLVQAVSAGSSSSELNVREECRDELLDTVKDDVALGIEIGLQLKAGETVFSATVEDSDKRDLHFFFIAPSEDVVVERLIAAFKGGRS